MPVLASLRIAEQISASNVIVDADLVTAQAAEILLGLVREGTIKAICLIQAAILAALRERDGGTVVGEGAPARWRLAHGETDGI